MSGGRGLMAQNKLKRQASKIKTKPQSVNDFAA